MLKFIVMAPRGVYRYMKVPRGDAAVGFAVTGGLRGAREVN